MVGRLEELRKAIAEHPGSVARTRWSRLRRTHKLLAGNLREFEKLISRPEGDTQVALDLVSNTAGYDSVQDVFFDEFDRLLHNVVAATGTLIDHSRIVAGQYAGTSFNDEYTRRVAEIRALPVAKFIKDLRNYILHQSLPAPSSRVELFPQKVTYNLFVSVPALLQSSKWSQGSRTYLVQHGDQLPIKKPLVEYSKAIDGIYQWMFDQSARLDVADIEAANILVDEYNDVLMGLRD